MANIDLKTLHELRAAQAAMARYYRERVGEKPEQNAAMIAAGLKPMHDENSIRWDQEGVAKYERFLAALDAVIAHLGGDVAEAA